MHAIKFAKRSYETVVWLYRTAHFIAKVRQKELVPYHITPHQAYVMYLIYNLGHKATLSEIAKYMNREINTTSVQLSRMEKDGLVKKSRETPKSNRLSFELTEKGRKIYYPIAKPESIELVMSVLSDEEQRQLISLLKKIVITAKKNVRAK